MAEHFLGHYFPSAQFSDDDWRMITTAFEQVRYAKDDHLLQEGAIANHYWFIESGILRSYAIDPKGHDLSLDFFTRGDVAIDWSSFLQQTPTRENIQALTEVVCWRLDFATFQQFFHGFEPFREAGRARLVGSYFALKRKSVSMIADQAKDRYRQLLAERPHLLQQVPLKQLASYLGITDTSLSRIRKEIMLED
ncbi:MAG: cyclic nucleotide-binding domain-containing protein [Bacteroidota bacterium]